MGRRLGQHFLVRPSVLDRIADLAAQQQSSSCIEIGPGRGALTGPLLERFTSVTAIEVDPVLVLYLRQKFRDAIAEGRLALLEADILKADLAALSTGSAAIVGNLPYYITSPILEKVFGLHAYSVFLVQLEVAQRIAASPSSREYGYLSVLSQIQSKPELIFEVPPAAFRPPPKVSSAVIRCVPRDPQAEWGLSDVPGFLRFASACFRHKRKTLRNNLAGVYGKEALDSIPEGRLRAEQMGVPELIELWRTLESA